MPKLEISEDIINRTTHCHSNFYCLNNEENPQCPVGLTMCKVERKIGEGMVFVKYNNSIACNYCLPFGKGDKICCCPVRYEIYERYNK